MGSCFARELQREAPGLAQRPYSSRQTLPPDSRRSACRWAVSAVTAKDAAAATNVARSGDVGSGLGHGWLQMRSNCAVVAGGVEEGCIWRGRATSKFKIG